MTIEQKEPETLQSYETIQPPEGSEGLIRYDAGQGLTIDLGSAVSLDEYGKVASVNLGGVPVQVLRLGTNDDGMPDAVFVARNTFDASWFFKPVDGNAVRAEWIMLRREHRTILGRDLPGAGRLGLNDQMVSRTHAAFTLTEENKLTIEDLGSLNKTFVDVAEQTEVLPLDQAKGSKLGRTALSGELTKSPEFKIGNVTFVVEGVSKRGNTIIRSIDSRGQERRFFVYKSKTEAALRVSQGQAEGRYVKGGEDDQLGQYTQETQLHPLFRERLSTAKPSSIEILEDIHLGAKDSDADPAREDFAALTQTGYFKDRRLAEVIELAKAGHFTRKDIQRYLPRKYRGDITRYIDDLNHRLARSDAMPDFSQAPVRSEQEYHPILNCRFSREVYVKNGIEWFMARTETGEVWIDRIRIAGSEVSPYGTDAQQIYSGILTSKPVEYAEQTDGLPDRYRQSVNGRYVDITKLLDTLLPIQRYRKARGVIRS